MNRWASTRRRGYEERGSGEPRVLLHGGLSDARFFHANVGPLAERFRVLTPDHRGHGRTPDLPRPFTFDAMADDTIAFIERVVGEQARDGSCWSAEASTATA